MSVQTQKSLLLSKSGDWTVGDRKVPAPGPGNVTVKIYSTALNPIDWKVKDYGLFVNEYPAVVGSDGAGTIEEVGEGVVQWKKGDKVFFQGFFEPDKGTFQQYAHFPADIVGKIPEGLSFDEAATVPLGIATAASCLYSYKGEDTAPAFTPPWIEGGEGKYAGKSIVILGGATSNGQYAIQLAKLSGFSKIVTTVSAHNIALVKDLGATHTIDRSKSNTSAQILTALNDTKPSIVIDSVSSGDTQALGWELVAPGGFLVVTLTPTIDTSKEAGPGKRHVFKVYGSVHQPGLRDFGYVMYAALPRLLAEGKIKPNAVEVVGGLGAIPAALERLKNGEVSGKKLVAHPFEN